MKRQGRVLFCLALFYAKVPRFRIAPSSHEWSPNLNAARSRRDRFQSTPLSRVATVNHTNKRIIICIIRVCFSYSSVIILQKAAL
jgi:hypothetical protein